MAAHRRSSSIERGVRAWGRAALAAPLLFLAACASTGEGPGVPWLLWATARSLAGAPPKPPDLYTEPVRVSDTFEFAAIAAGGDHTCALTIDGETYCWGSNRYEQLGTAAVTETCGGDGPRAFSCSSTPVRLPDVPRFTALAAMRWGTCGLDESGAAHCWGYGLGGRTEEGFLVSSAAPVRVPGGPFVALASSASSNGGACGLTAEGRVWCWGLIDGADGSASGVLTGPTVVPTDIAFTEITFGGTHGCGLDAARRAHCWGNNLYGSLGTGSSGYYGGIRESAAPVAVQGSLELERVVAGGGHSCGLTTEGAVHCWGVGYPVDGQIQPHPRLRAGPLPHGALPVPVDLRSARWSTLHAADTQTCGLTAEGKAYCFRGRRVPAADGRAVEVESEQTFVDLAVGNRHACAIGTDARAYCWGDGSEGQVGRRPSRRRW